MQNDWIEVSGERIRVYRTGTVIVGSGAAGLNCACQLFKELRGVGVEHPEKEILLVTRGIGRGTSNNSGSDKQTYYRLGTHGDKGDSTRAFAETLTSGGCTHGDLALVEATNSLRAFHHLVEIGVPFPHDEFGDYVGYRTDNDPGQRATSAGPWTSRLMVQRLLAEMRSFGIPVLDGLHMIAIASEGEGDEKRSCGIVCSDIREETKGECGLVLIMAANIVVAGGGAGELYEASVYPSGQMGPYAALLDAGARAVNLAESQFGIASINPRWNLSGTYQQVVPRYFSTDQQGDDEKEFLNRYFDSMGEMATSIFLKGYEWPFDPEKIEGPGSSLIDVLVYEETVNKGRKVFMDFRENPRAGDGLGEFCIDELGPEARDYLLRCGASQATPIERLAQMNQPSIDLFEKMGVDLRTQPVEIAVCAQHCNGGFDVDTWWETNVAHLFVVGELAGTHGVRRPGGAALNSGQVGGLRAAQRIAQVYSIEKGHDAVEAALPVVERYLDGIALVRAQRADSLDSSELIDRIKGRMSRYAGMVRSKVGIGKAFDEAEEDGRRILEKGIRQEGKGYLLAMKARELFLTHRAFLESIRQYVERGGGSRGSCLVTGADGSLPREMLDEGWRYLAENRGMRDEILGIEYDMMTAEFRHSVEKPRPIPHPESWFENTWADYREGRVFRSRRDASGKDGD